MQDTITHILHLATVAGAIHGAAAAAVVDVHAFLSWRSAHDFVIYDWGTASFRWFQGAVAGALVGAGLSYMIGG